MGKVLIACEESQAVCKAFRERGHAAKAAIDAQVRAEDERVGELWRWKLDLENACEEFTETDWR